MRLIGTVENEKKAFVFYSALLKEGIHCTYEKGTNVDGKPAISIWIYEEDQLEAAQALLEEYKKNPSAERFSKVEFPTTPPLPPDNIADKTEQTKEEEQERLWRLKERLRKKQAYPLTYFFMMTCILLYLFSWIQSAKLIKEDGILGGSIGMTPIQQELMFEYPKTNQVLDQLIQKYSLKSVKQLNELPQDELVQIQQAQKLPTWNGLLGKFTAWYKRSPDQSNDGPLFVQIKEGEVWRLFTPCLLHGSFLHILFNMLWAWVLLKQTEERLPRWKIILLILIIGIVSNVGQYLISGPYFLGFSGIVCGLVGYIWVRQKFAPWEGYPLQRSTIIFILVFVGAMFALEIFSLATSLFFAKEVSANIANTAHIIGGLTGALLGRIPFFSRGLK